MWIKSKDTIINMELVTSVRLGIEELNKNERPHIAFFMPNDNCYIHFETIEEAKEAYNDLLLSLDKRGKFTCP